MKQLTTILLLLFTFACKAQILYVPDNNLNYDTSEIKPALVTDTVDAVVLSAYISKDNDYSEIRLDYVKAVRTGYVTIVNLPLNQNDLVYRPTETVIWEDIKYYTYYVQDNVEFYLPYSKQVLEYWIVIKQ